jgi:hypothetical protein
LSKQSGRCQTEGGMVDRPVQFRCGSFTMCWNRGRWNGDRGAEVGWVCVLKVRGLGLTTAELKDGRNDPRCLRP